MKIVVKGVLPKILLMSLTSSYGGARRVTVIVLGSGIDYPSSNVE